MTQTNMTSNPTQRPSAVASNVPLAAWGAGHVAIFVNDTAVSRAFYEEVLDLQWSQTDTPNMTALTRVLRQSLTFMSCGKNHHDLVLVEEFNGHGKTVAVAPNDLMHISFFLQPGHTLAEIAERARAHGATVTEGAVFPAITGDTPAISFHDPNGHLVEILASNA